MTTVSGICQRLIQRDSRLTAAGSVSDFMHLLATRETRRALEQGKLTTARELDIIEKRVYLLVTQFIEQKTNLKTQPLVKANGKLGVKRTRNVTDSVSASD